MFPSHWDCHLALGSPTTFESASSVHPCMSVPCRSLQNTDSWIVGLKPSPLSHAPGRRCCGFQTTLGAARKDSRTLGARGIRAKGPRGMLWVCLSLKRVVAALRKTPPHPTSPQAMWMWRGSDHLISPPLPLPLSH